MVSLTRLLFRLFGGKPDPAFDEAVLRLRQVPGNTQPILKAELINYLRALAHRRPSNKEELVQLEAEAFVLAERIEKSPVSNETPHNVWHFLSDSDIRFKDARDSERQIGELLGLLQSWERNGA